MEFMLRERYHIW